MKQSSPGSFSQPTLRDNRITSAVSTFIATGKRGYPHNIFLISRRIHMLWYLLEVPH